MTRLAALGRRNALVDALRGVCFVFMTVDHFPGSPFLRFSNPYYGPFGFFTAALGFIFLSGLVAGFVYEDHRVRYGFRSLIRRILRRVRALYVTQIVLVLALVVAVRLNLPGVDRWHLDVLDTDPLKGLLLGVSMLYEPGYLGILPMYCLFLLLTPILIRQFQKGRLRYVLGISGLLWLVSGLVIRLPDNPNGIDFGAFNPLAYQLLFIVGLAFGTKQPNLERVPYRNWLIGVAFTIAGLFFILRLQYALHGPFNPLAHRLGASFSAVQLGPLRLLNFAAFGLTLFWVVRKIRWADVDTAAFRWLAFLGRHSLPVFAWSILTAYAAVALYPSHPSVIAGMLGVFLAAASLTIPAQLRATFVGRRKKPTPAPSIDAHHPPGGGLDTTLLAAEEAINGSVEEARSLPKPRGVTLGA
jgi:hypothetical protein